MLKLSFRGLAPVHDWEGVGPPTRRSRVWVCAPLTLCMVFYIFSWANHTSIFYKDYDIIGKLWTYHNNSTHSHIKGLTYDTSIIVQIIVNIIYDIICMKYLK